jgi:ribosomal protein L32
MVVRMRSTRSHTGNRRSHHALVAMATSKEGGAVHMRHVASATTGTYKGRIVKSLQKKIDRKAKRIAEKAKSQAK